MGKEIEKSVVERVALLSRLSLNAAELEAYSKQLAAILSYISKLNEVDTSGVLPTSHALTTLRNVFRKDAPRPALGADDALANAPAREGDFFKVPQVIENK